MKRKVKETDEWIVEKDDEKRIIIVSNFEDGHYRDEIIISYDELNFIK